MMASGLPTLTPLSGGGGGAPLEPQATGGGGDGGGEVAEAQPMFVSTTSTELLNKLTTGGVQVTSNSIKIIFY